MYQISSLYLDDSQYNFKNYCVYIYIYIYIYIYFPGGVDSKESACNAGDPGSVSGLGRSPGDGEGNGKSFQYSYLENSMDRGVSRATVHGVKKSLT